MKILIVDDEEDIEMLFRQKFRAEIRSGDFTLEFVLSAELALNYLKLLSPFDVVLVLSDINMPGMSGIDLLKLIRENFPFLKVIMISAYGDSVTISNASELGAIDFLTKPIDFSALKDKIHSYCKA